MCGRTSIEMMHFRVFPCREEGELATSPSAVPEPAGVVLLGTGSAAIRDTMLPNNRRVRWLSARSSQ
jgi:hypothetical protein